MTEILAIVGSVADLARQLMSAPVASMLALPVLGTFIGRRFASTRRRS